MKRYSSQFPDPVVLVSVATAKIKNAMTVGWASPVSFDPPILMVSIAPKRLNVFRVFSITPSAFSWFSGCFRNRVTERVRALRTYR